MSNVYPTGVALGLALLFVVVELLRRRHLREKYAALWIVVGLGGVTLAVFPKLLVATADLLGFEVPANLLFLLAVVVLTAITMQLSQELGELEAEGQRLAEEAAIQTMRLDALEAHLKALESALPPDGGQDRR